MVIENLYSSENLILNITLFIVLIFGLKIVLYNGIIKGYISLKTGVVNRSERLFLYLFFLVFYTLVLIVIPIWILFFQGTEPF